MKMLMVDDRIPRAALGAGYPRANALIHALLPACERFAFYPLVFPDESQHAPYAELDTRVELLLSRGYAGLGATLREYCDQNFDTLWVSRPENMRFVDAVLATLPDVRDRFTVVYDAEALYAPRTVQMYALTGAPLDIAAANQMYADEVGVAGRADLLVSVSEAEAAAFRERTGRVTFVLGFTSIPNPTDADFAARQDFGFAGGIRPSSPNEDSLLWYAANVMHELRARTGAALRVVGFIDSPHVLAYGGEALLLHGPVEHLHPFFETIRVFVAPTRFAAGLPQKLIDAASAGVPIVATSLLADALGWRNNQELLVADDALTFVAACVRLYGEKRLWYSLRDAALQAVGASYGARIFGRQVSAIVEAIARLQGERSISVT